MPLFDHGCRACGHVFEALVRGRRRPRCPRCGSQRLERKLGRFAVATSKAAAAAAPPAPAGCGTCGDPRGPGSCER